MGVVQYPPLLGPKHSGKPVAMSRWANPHSRCSSIPNASHRSSLVIGFVQDLSDNTCSAHSKFSMVYPGGPISFYLVS